MTPYLIGGQWIDLDHVLAVDDTVFPDSFNRVIGCVTLAFRDAPLEIVVGHMTCHPASPPITKASSPDRWSGREAGQVIWDAFITEWKGRRSDVVSEPTVRRLMEAYS